jgi:hypothetical protein
MDYQKAKNIRSKSFSDLITDKLVGGQGVGSSLRETISEKTKAKMTGIKETFDPMNIVKTMTFGSKLGPALYGKMMGRSKEDMKYFTDKKTRGPNKNKTPGQLDSQYNSMAVEALGLIYRLMLRNLDDEKLRKEQEQSSIEERDSEEERRNQELVKALTARRKKEKPKKEKPTKEKPKPEPKKEPPKKGRKKEEVKPTEKKPKAEKAPSAKETPKAAPEKVPPKESPKAPEKVTPKEAPKAPTPSVKPPTAAKLPPGQMTGSKGLVLSALIAAGYSKSAQANIMANVEKESNFNPRSEGIPKPEKIFSMFGPPGVKGGQPENGKNKVRFQTLQDAQDIVAAGPEAYFNKVYDGRMGNTSPGDGYKYRGRGFIQITGKDMYNRVGKLIGEDLLSNPDLANTPEVAAKIIPAFFQLKLKERNLSVDSYDNIDKVNEVVGSADVKSREQRKTLAATYVNELNIGNQIDQSSKENKDLKDSLDKNKPKQTVTNNNTVTMENKETKQSTETVDDRPAHLKKKG